MNRAFLSRVKIIELYKGDPSLPKLDSHYLTTSYYDLSVICKPKAWKTDFTLKPLKKPIEKNYIGTFFSEHIEEPKVFVAVLTGVHIGWIELGYEKWNNRMRIWELFVKEEFRKMGVATLLMKHAIKVAKERGARMLVLETQSCNVPAITFYQKQGFKLVGFDSVAYSNKDIEKKEVRMEFGLAL